MVRRKGFTLPELLVTLALFGIMATLSLPFLGDFYRSENTGAHCRNVRQALYRASTKSIAGELGRPWGVTFSGNSYTLFAGNTYATRLPSYDETFTIPGGMTFPSSQTFRFQLYSGLPMETGTVSILFDGESVLCATVQASGLVESEQ